MKFNELISHFEIQTSNEEAKLLDKIEDGLGNGWTEHVRCAFDFAQTCAYDT